MWWLELGVSGEFILPGQPNGEGVSDQYITQPASCSRCVRGLGRCSPMCLPSLRVAFLRERMQYGRTQGDWNRLMA